MASDSFMLLNLREKQSKKLAQVISNETSRQILDFLAGTEHSTETDIANKLSIPLSTVHYNLKALKDANLIVVEEFHYSQKGKEVPHYKLANKFIIIAPRDDAKIFDRLKKFFPVAVLAVGVSAAIHFAQKMFFSKGVLVAQEAMIKSSAEPFAESVGIAQQRMIESAQDAVSGGNLSNAYLALEEGVHNVSENLSQVFSPETIPTQQPPLALWFLFGAFFVLMVLVVWELVRRKDK